MPAVSLDKMFLRMSNAALRCGLAYFERDQDIENSPYNLARFISLVPQRVNVYNLVARDGRRVPSVAMFAPWPALRQCFPLL